MKFLPILAIGAVTSTSVLAATIPNAKRESNPEKFLVEFEQGKTEWVTEDDKWELKRNGKHFIDITKEHAEGFTPQISVSSAGANKFPSTMQQKSAVKAVIAELSKENMERDLTTFSEFHNRYYQAQTGVESATWLSEQVQAAIDDAGVEGAKVERVEHDFAQFSIVATIPGESEEVVVVGAHQDSINLNDPSNGRAPGADDNGSGSVTILEAFREILKDETISQGKSPFTIEFHWYAGEEAGLLGSQAIFSSYRQSGKKVKGMLNQDMTGYIKGMTGAGIEESFGLITDNSDADLLTFVEGVIKEYCSIPAIRSSCGYACSDHASANRNGYPAAMVFEAPMEYSHPDIHSEGDVIGEVSFDHMLEHGKLVVGFTLELALGSS